MALVPAEALPGRREIPAGLSQILWSAIWSGGGPGGNILPGACLPTTSAFHGKARGFLFAFWKNTVRISFFYEFSPKERGNNMETVIFNANIYLEREKFAQALLIRDGVIAQVGTNEEVLSAAGADASRMDAQGRTIVPGFNDSHQHLFGVGQMQLSVDLTQCTSRAGMVEAGRKFIAQRKVAPGTTVTGRGWNQDYFTDGHEMPTRELLDQISTEHPIIFTRACGHAVVCNTLALQKAGVWDNVPQPEGGQFDVDGQGRPTGIAREDSAIDIVHSAVVPPMDEAQMEEILRTAVAYAASRGLTSVQTNDVRSDNYEAMLRVYNKVLHEENAPLRAYLQCCFMDPDSLKEFFAAGHRTGEGDDYVKVGPLKLFTDGSLGARTAYLRQDYADEPGQRGISTLTQGDLDTLIQMADDNHTQVGIHAIGDKAIEMCLNSYEKVLKGGPNVNRHGIIHWQITDNPLLQRFKDLDVLALVQPIFLHYDMHICAARVGEELAATSYNFGTMGRMGIHVSYGTDSPVEGLDPINNLHCAVNRQDLKRQPTEGWLPREKVDIYTAVDNYTIGSAYASFEENRKGRLAPGFLADLVMLDQDIFHVPSEKILDTHVLMTMVGGNVVYTAE